MILRTEGELCMSRHSFDPKRWNRISLGLGGTVWMLIVLAGMLHWMTPGSLELLLLLALCVITPLAIPLVLIPKENRLLSDLAMLVLFLQPFASFFGGISILSDRGGLAGAFAIIWLFFTLLIALIGMLLLLQKSDRRLSIACLALALIYLPIGSTWLVLDRLRVQPLGFSQTTVLLTAVHFHFITLAALLMIGLIGQSMQATQQSRAWKMYRVLALCMLINPLLVATGFTVTQVTGMHALESAAAILLAMCMILIALFNLKLVVPATASLLARGLLIVSSTAVVITMLFACAYALGEATGLWEISISNMILVHGWVNAIVFGFCGLLGWRLRRAQE